MRRLVIAALLLAGLGLTGCFGVPGNTGSPQSQQAADCQQGVQQALDQLGARAVASSIVCAQNTSLGEGGAYFVQNNSAAVFYGWPSNPGVTWFQRSALHEEGHAWYFQQLNNDQRDRYAQIRPTWNEFESYADDFQSLTGGFSTGTYPQTPPIQPWQSQALCGEGVVPC